MVAMNMSECWAVQTVGASQGSGIASDGAGGALVTGYFSGISSFGSMSLTSRGNFDAFVMHVTASGVIDWAIQFGGVYTDVGNGIAHDDTGGAIVTGYFSGKASFGSMSLTSERDADAFVMHITASGVIDWVIQAGGPSADEGCGVAHDGAGGALVTGYFSGKASFGSMSLAGRSVSLTSRGSGDTFVMHMTASGDIDWVIQAGGTADDAGYGIASDGAGGALVTGYFSGTATFGSMSLSSQTGVDAFVMHVTASGVIDWVVQADRANGNGIAHDHAGGALVTGYFSGKASFGSKSLTSRGGSFDAFVMHVTASGVIDWVVQAGGGSSDEGNGISHDGAGGALVTGHFRGKALFGSIELTSRGRLDAFVMHITASGDIDRVVQAGGTSTTYGQGIAYDGAGGALVTGDFEGNASFGSKTLTSHIWTETSCFAASLMMPAVPLVPVPPPGAPGVAPPAPGGAPPPPGGAPPPPGGTPPAPGGAAWLLGGAPSPASPSNQPSAVVVPEQPAAGVAALATTSLALLGLLLACVYRRRYRRMAENFRVSRERAQLDLHMLEHRFKQHTGPQWKDSHWAMLGQPPGPPSESPQNSIPPGPPSSSGSGRRGSNGGGAGSDTGSSGGGKCHGGGGCSTAGSDVAMLATSRGRDAFGVIYDETIDAVFKADSREAGLARLRPYLDANMSKQSADAFQVWCGKLFVLSRVHTSMAPEVSFAKVQEITDALSRECSMASHTAAPLVAGLKRFVEQRILPNGALDRITEQGFRLPADEVGALLDRYRWPHDAKRTQVMYILRKTLEAVAELRSTSDAAVRDSESIEEARLILNHSHERLIRTVESVLDEHAMRADPTLVLGRNLFVAVSRVVQAQEQENVNRLQSRSWPPLHSRVQTVFAEAEARAKAAVKAEAKAKAMLAEEVAMAAAQAAAAAAAAAAAETAKEVVKSAAEEANRERLERYREHEQVPPICPSRFPHSNPHLQPAQISLLLHAQAEAEAAKEAEMNRKARAEHSREQRAKALEHSMSRPTTILSTCGQRLHPAPRSACTRDRG